jgi:hypothetical protein
METNELLESTFSALVLSAAQARWDDDSREALARNPGSHAAWQAANSVNSRIPQALESIADVRKQLLNEGLMPGRP